MTEPKPRRAPARRSDAEPASPDLHAHLESLGEGLRGTLRDGLEDIRKEVRGEMASQAILIRQNREANYSEHLAVQAQIGAMNTLLGEHIVEDRTGRKVLTWLVVVLMPLVIALLIWALNHFIK